MALTSKPTPAFTHNPTEDLGDYVMPQLIEWWKIVRVEHACYYKNIAEIKAKIRKADREIGPAKKRDGTGGAVTKGLIRRRRLCHDQVKPLETHIYMLKRQLACVDNIFDSAIEPYSRISSLSFTTALYTKCPRELRDMVYYYLLDAHMATDDDDSALQIHQLDGTVIDSTLIFLNSGYVHEEVLSEIMYLVGEKKKKKAAQKPCS